MGLVSTLTESAFVARRQGEWDKLDALLQAVRARGLRRLGAERVVEIAPLYRDVCADLARAQAARYSAALLDYLHGLTAAAHAVVYGRQSKPHASGRARWRMRGLRLALALFPRAVRRHRAAVGIACSLFFVPLLGALFATLADPNFAARVVPESVLGPLTEGYREGFDAGRAVGIDATMAGFYVSNNVGIALRCFATGIVFGLGSALYLVENGLMTGAILGHVASHGGGENILTFIVGHSSLELGAIVLAGGAGLALGWSIVSPGEQTRVASLRACAKSVVAIVFGAAVMLFMAAGIEAFWSASSVRPEIKRAVGATLFVVVLGYIVFGGKTSAEAQAIERAQVDPWT
jgi:uncharacterized membrane protein SpoIIM required for sporulation